MKEGHKVKKCLFFGLVTYSFFKNSNKNKRKMVIANFFNENNS